MMRFWRIIGKMFKAKRTHGSDLIMPLRKDRFVIHIRKNSVWFPPIEVVGDRIEVCKRVEVLADQHFDGLKNVVALTLDWRLPPFDRSSIVEPSGIWTCEQPREHEAEQDEFNNAAVSHRPVFR